MTPPSVRSDLPTRVYLVEDDVVLRDSLAAALTYSGYDVHQFANAEDLLTDIDRDLSTASTVGCVVTDIDLPGMNGLQLQTELATRPHLTVVVISGVATASHVVSAFRTGAAEVLLKPFDIQDLLAAITRATARLSRKVATLTATAVWRQRLVKLTRRQRQVVMRVATGKLNREIAEELGLALRTVKLHRNRGFAQLGLTRVADLARNIADHGGLDAS